MGWNWKTGLFIRFWWTGHNTPLDTPVSMTSWAARGHGDAPAKHSHLVLGHRPSPWWQQDTSLSDPACWTPLGKINRQGSPWKILRQWTNTKFQQVPKTVFILALVLILKIAAVISVLSVAVEFLWPSSSRSSRGTCGKQNEGWSCCWQGAVGQRSHPSHKSSLSLCLSAKLMIKRQIMWQEIL